MLINGRIQQSSSSCDVRPPTKLRKCDRQVSFTHLDVITFNLTIGDHTSCGFGPPIALGSEVRSERASIPIEEYETNRTPRRSVDELMLSRVERWDRLKDAGLSDKEVWHSERNIQLREREEFFGPSVQRRLDVGRQQPKQNCNPLFPTRSGQGEQIKEPKNGPRRTVAVLASSIDRMDDPHHVFGRNLRQEGYINTHTQLGSTSSTTTPAKMTFTAATDSRSETSSNWNDGRPTISDETVIIGSNPPALQENSPSQAKRIKGSSNADASKMKVFEARRVAAPSSTGRDRAIAAVEVAFIKSNPFAMLGRGSVNLPRLAVKKSSSGSGRLRKLAPFLNLRGVGKMS